jgi:ribonucleoside-diphosphate reductase alpha chain
MNLRFEPAGMTDDSDVRMAQSMLDYIFRRLALDYLPFEDRAAMGLYTASERARALETGEYTPDSVDNSVDTESLAQGVQVAAPVAPVAPVAPSAKPVEVKIEAAPAAAVGSSTELLEKISGIKSDAPLCMTCGVKMRQSGACYVCEGCGSTSGCS